MAISGVGGAIGAGLPPNNGRIQRPDETRQQPATWPAAPAPAESQTAIPADSSAEIPAEAPPGTDPAMWSVLTAEERLYFTRLQALGPLTYARRPAQPQAGMARGARIDRTV